MCWRPSLTSSSLTCSSGLTRCSSTFDDDDGGAAVAIAKKVAVKAKQKTMVLKLFVKDVANVNEDEYVVTIKGTMRYELAMDHLSMRYELAMDHLSTGMSFR